MFLRFLNGLGASFVCIFCPVWIDQFGPLETKSILIALNNLSSLLGVILGFIMSSLISKTEMPWNTSYLFQSFFLGGGFLVMMFIRSKYFDRRLERLKDTNIFQVKDEVLKEKAIRNLNNKVSYGSTKNMSEVEKEEKIRKEFDNQSKSSSKNDMIKNNKSGSTSELKFEFNDEPSEICKKSVPYLHIIKSLLANTVSYWYIFILFRHI